MIKKILCLFLIILSSCQKETTTETIRPVRAIQVKESLASDNSIIFPGTLRAFKRADLSFRVDGMVIKRNIDVGQEVKKDEILIQLDPREYKIAVQKAKAKIDSTRAQLDFAARDFARMQRIFELDPGAISESLVDRKKETNNQLAAELDIAKREYDKAADDLSYTSLKSPFDGIVSAIYVENHEQIQAKRTVLRLIDTADREMEIYIPQKYIGTLLEDRANLNFEVRLDVFPDKTFPAVIKEIGTESSSTTQSYPVTLSLKNIPVELSILSGMSGRATLQERSTNTDQKAFQVPKSAIFTDNLQQNYVWIVEPKTKTVKKQPVTLEENNTGDFSLIKGGVSTGDWVVTAGTSFLSEGQRVELVK